MILRRLIVESLILILCAALIASYVVQDRDYEWQWFALLSTYSLVWLLIFCVRLSIACSIFKRSLNRTDKWIFWIKNWDPILHGVNAAISLTMFDEYRFIDEVTSDHAVNKFGTLLAWLMFAH